MMCKFNSPQLVGFCSLWCYFLHLSPTKIIFFSVKVSRSIQGDLALHFLLSKSSPMRNRKIFWKKLYLNFKCFLIINLLVKIRSFSTYKINFWINLRIFSYFANKSSYRCSGSLSNHLFWFSGGFLKTGFSRTLNTELLPVKIKKV